MENNEKLIWFVPLELREPNIDFSKFQKYNKNYKLCKGIYLLKFGNEYYIGKTNDKSGFQQRFRKHKMYIKKYLEVFENLGFCKIISWFFYQSNFTILAFLIFIIFFAFSSSASTKKGLCAHAYGRTPLNRAKEDPLKLLTVVWFSSFWYIIY